MHPQRSSGDVSNLRCSDSSEMHAGCHGEASRRTLGVYKPQRDLVSKIANSREASQPRNQTTLQPYPASRAGVLAHS